MVLVLFEPPYTEPYVRWCGRTAGVTPPPTRFVPAELGGGCLSLGVGHHFLAVDDLRFGLKPIVEVAPVLAAARLKEFIRAEADSFFQRPDISIPTGWFGTLVIDRGFADGFLAPVEPLGVALPPFRFGVFLCHMHRLLNHRFELVCDRRHGGDLRMRVGEFIQR